MSKTLNLPSGKIAILEPGKGRDLLQAQMKAKTSDPSLPNMSVDPYVQYGVGLQKKIGKRFTGFGQAMMRNGSRNGVALQFGFRWSL